jgi:signal transduction histidine kinase
VIDNRVAQVREITGAQDLGKPQVLYAGPGRARSLRALLAAAGSPAVLSVTDEDGGLAAGSAVNFKISGAGMAMSVKDTGIGFDPQALPELFAMFSQVDSAIARSEGGLGIGLALVKGLIELHGGTIEGFSAGPGWAASSRFICRNPR